MPLTGVACEVPARVPPPGFVPSVRSIGPAAEGTVLPNASTIATRTAGLMTVPAAVAPGCVEKLSPAGAPGFAVAPNDSGDPAAPGRVAVACWAPAAAPSVQETAERPAGSVGAVTAERVPPVAAFQVTGAPLTGFPYWSRATTTSESARNAPTVPDCPSPFARTITLARPACATATNVAGDPARPGALATALSWLVPATVPSVQETAARPAASVGVTAAESAPDPADTSQPMTTPGAGFPYASCVTTTNASCSGSPTVPVCALPDAMAIRAGAAGVAVAANIAVLDT